MTEKPSSQLLIISKRADGLYYVRDKSFANKLAAVNYVCDQLNKTRPLNQPIPKRESYAPKNGQRPREV